MDYQKDKIKSPSITPASDRSIMLRFEDGISEYIHEHVFYFHSLLVKKFKKKIANTSPAYNSILIRLADGVSVWRMIAKLKQLFEEEHEISIEQKQTVKIPVCYDKEFALDIDRVSKHTKLNTDEIIPIHWWYGSKTRGPKVRLPASKGNARFCRHWRKANWHISNY